MADPPNSTWRWGPTDREIAALTVPALGALIAEPLYVLADTAVVGRLGTPQLGGLALASTVLLIGYSVFIFLAYATTGSVGRLLGAGQDKEAAQQAVQSVWLAFFVGVGVAIAAAIAAEPLLRLLGGDGEVLGHGLVYLRVSLLGFPALLVGLAGVGYLRGLQDTRRPFYVALGSAAFNLVLEVVLVFGFDFGIGASALSTVLAQWISALAYIFWIKQAVAHHDVGLRPDRRTISSLAVAGFDLMLRTAALRGGLTVVVAVAARLGTTELAAHQIAFEVWNILALSLDAVAIAGQSLIARELGAGRADRARALGRRMIEWGIATGVGLGVLVLVLRPFAPSWFSQDPAVISLAGFLLLHAALVQPINGVAFALDGVLIGAGDLRFLAWGMLGASVVLVVGASLVLSFSLGMGWLWFALEAWMLSRAVTLVIRFRSDNWIVTGARR